MKKSSSILKCLDCKVDISGFHSNRKRCASCVSERLKRPQGTMTKKQILEAVSLAGKMPRYEIAKKLGVSLSNLKRSCHGVKFNYFNRYAANSEMVREVCRYYEKHGKKKTQEKFPEICVRSVVERYKFFKPRQSRWTDQEIIELVKFAGLISFKNQAKFFARPLANEGSIKSVWAKRFNTHPGYMHGLPMHKAKIFLRPDCPVIEYQEQQRGGVRRMILFCDAVKYFKEDCPRFVRRAILAMAEFQELLFGKDPRTEIESMLAAFS